MSEEFPDIPFISPLDKFYNRVRKGLSPLELMEESSTQQMLNALARGQHELRDEMARGREELSLILRQLLDNRNNGNDGNHNRTNGQNGHNGGQENNDTAQSNARTASRATPRPLMPTFLREQGAANQDQQVREEGYGDYLREYNSLGDDFRAAMSLVDFCGLKLRNRPRNNQWGVQNQDLQRKVGKLTLPSFDGSNNGIARAWVQKLDTYLQLNPMLETEAIQYATLHLEGGTMDLSPWGMPTLLYIWNSPRSSLTGLIVRILNSTLGS